MHLFFRYLIVYCGKFLSGYVTVCLYIAYPPMWVFSNHEGLGLENFVYHTSYFDELNSKINLLCMAIKVDIGVELYTKYFTM